MPSKWASRFIASAIIHAEIAAAITLYIVLGQLTFLKPEPSRVLAFGSAGTWFMMGYLSYILVGVVGVAVTALFYYYIEEELNRPLIGVTSGLARLHFLLMNIGVVGATWLMMYSGYLGGAAMLPAEVGGRGWNPGQVHANVFLAIPLGYPFWITVFIVLLAAGVLLGSLGYLITWLRRT